MIGKNKNSYFNIPQYDITFRDKHLITNKDFIIIFKYI